MGIPWAPSISRIIPTKCSISYVPSFSLIARQSNDEDEAHSLNQFAITLLHSLQYFNDKSFFSDLSAIINAMERKSSWWWSSITQSALLPVATNYILEIERV